MKEGREPRRCPRPTDARSGRHSRTLRKCGDNPRRDRKSAAIVPRRWIPSDYRPLRHLGGLYLGALLRAGSLRRRPRSRSMRRCTQRPPRPSTTASLPRASSAVLRSRFSSSIGPGPVRTVTPPIRSITRPARVSRPRRARWRRRRTITSSRTDDRVGGGPRVVDVCPRGRLHPGQRRVGAPPGRELPAGRDRVRRVPANRPREGPRCHRHHRRSCRPSSGSL